jgi:hypothetical protein
MLVLHALYFAHLRIGGAPSTSGGLIFMERNGYDFPVQFCSAPVKLRARSTRRTGFPACS